MKKIFQNHETTKIFTKEIQVIIDFEILKTIVFHKRKKKTVCLKNVSVYVYNNNKNRL